MFGPKGDGMIVVNEYINLPFGFVWLKWQIFDSFDNDGRFIKIIGKLYKKR